MTLDDILIEIKQAESFVILTHENPDGDAIGSACAMYGALKKLGKDEIDIYLKDCPKDYNYLETIKFLKKEPEDKKYDIAIVLDCPNLTRVSMPFRNYFEKSNVKIQIDHHHNNTMFGDYNMVDPVSPACTQILSSCFDYWHIDTDKEIATAILTGIVTDTYGFSSPETTTESFEFAGWALSKGVNVSKVYRSSLTKISKAKFDIQKIATDRLALLEDGKVAFTYIMKNDEEQCKTSIGDLNSIVEIGRNIEGVEISVFIYETVNGYKLSLRSNEYIDCSAIAMMFGGGGHLRSAGANLEGNFEELKSKVLVNVKNYLKQ